jgi:hypothetical protein
MPVIVDLDGSGFDRKEAEKHQHILISRISDISVLVFSYAIKNNQLADTGKKPIPIARGVDCFNRILWTKEVFVQVPNQGKRSLTLCYDFGGNQQNVSFDIDPPKTDDFWKLGVLLDDRLRLNVYIGNENQNTYVIGLDLSLQSA